MRTQPPSMPKVRVAVDLATDGGSVAQPLWTDLG